MAISAKDVMELRKQTDCGMMECKKALTEADGNFEGNRDPARAWSGYRRQEGKPRCCRGYGLR